MTKENPKTDPKLIAVLSAGKALLNSADPEGILRECFPLHVTYDLQTSSWQVTVLSKNGIIIRVKGRGNGQERKVTGLSFATEGKQWQDVPAEASETVCSAVGPLSGIPARLKQTLASPDLGTAPDAKAADKFEKAVRLAFDALFWDTEKPQATEYEKDFRRIEFKFKPDREGNTRSVQFQSKQKINGSIITVTADADIYGLGKKKVTLEKDLGQGRAIEAGCTVRRDGRDHPSLRVAYDLGRRLTAIYSDEREEALVNSPEERKTGMLKKYADERELVKDFPILESKKNGAGCLNREPEPEEMVDLMEGTRCFVIIRQEEPKAYLQLPAENDSTCIDLISKWLHAKYPSWNGVSVIELEKKLFVKISIASLNGNRKEIQSTILVKDKGGTKGSGFAPQTIYDPEKGTFTDPPEAKWNEKFVNIIKKKKETAVRTKRYERHPT